MTDASQTPMAATPMVATVGFPVVVGNPVLDEVAAEDLAVEGRVSIDRSGRIHTRGLPVELSTALEEFDTDGTGVCMTELTAAAYKWHRSKGDLTGFELACFPESLQQMLKVFDQDGDGTVDRAELATAGRLYKDAVSQARMLRRAVVIMALALVLLLACTVGLMWVVVDQSKEVTVSGGAMLSKTEGTPVQTARVMVPLPLGALPRMSWDFLEQLDKISISDGAQESMRKIAGVNRVDESSLTIWTTLGDEIEIQSAVVGAVRWAGGNVTSELCPACSECASIDVVMDEATEDLLTAYEDDLDSLWESGQQGSCEGKFEIDGRRLRRRCRRR